MFVSGIASGLGIPVSARIVGGGKLSRLLVGCSGLRGDSLKFSLCEFLRLRRGVLDPRLRLEVIPGAPRPAAVVERPHVPASRNANVHGRAVFRGASDAHRDPASRRLRSAPGADMSTLQLRNDQPTRRVLPRRGRRQLEFVAYDERSANGASCSRLSPASDLASRWRAMTGRRAAGPGDRGGGRSCRYRGHFHTVQRRHRKGKVPRAQDGCLLARRRSR
jgi:hypothetical protein